MWLSQMIEFPKLGLRVEYLPESIPIFGELEISLYGILVALAVIAGFLMVRWQAVRQGLDRAVFLDFALQAAVPALLGARVIFVAFSWKDYLEEPLRILSFRSDGMEIYGVILTMILLAMVYARRKKLSFWQLMDVMVAGLLVVQIVTRWGDFLARDAFGGYTNNMFAMRLSIQDVEVSAITEEMLYHAKVDGYPGFIQVHPLFLYEVLGNLILLFVILTRTKYKKFQGELFLLYLFWYGAGRFALEWLRTKNLLLWGVEELPILQIISAFFVLMALLLWPILRRRRSRQEPVAFRREYKM